MGVSDAAAMSSGSSNISGDVVLGCLERALAGLWDMYHAKLVPECLLLQVCVVWHSKSRGGQLAQHRDPP